MDDIQDLSQTSLQQPPTISESQESTLIQFLKPPDTVDLHESCVILAQ